MRPSSTRILLAFALLALTGCGRGRGPAASTPGPAPTPSTPYPAAVRLYYDNGSTPQDSARSVIRDLEALRSVWQRLTAAQGSPPPMPAVDFSREMLALVAAGRLTPDDQIRVDSVAVTREMDAAGKMTETLNIVVTTVTGCRRFNAEAYPVEIVRLRRFAGPVKWVERQTQAEGCRQSDAPPGGRR